MDGSYTPLSEEEVGAGGHNAPPPLPPPQFHPTVRGGASPQARPQAAGTLPAQPQPPYTAVVEPTDAELYTMEAGDVPGWGLPSQRTGHDPASAFGRRDWTGGLFQWVGASCAHSASRVDEEAGALLAQSPTCTAF
jgi:hypothetical protein